MKKVKAKMKKKSKEKTLVAYGKPFKVNALSIESMVTNQMAQNEKITKKKKKKNKKYKKKSCDGKYYNCSRK